MIRQLNELPLVELFDEAFQLRSGFDQRRSNFRRVFLLFLAVQVRNFHRRFVGGLDLFSDVHVSDLRYDPSRGI